MKTAVAYIRVSTDMQTEYSPDSQLKLIKDYAEKHDMVLCEVYSDPGISGRTVEKRPAFNRMIADAKKDKFNVILIYNTSRFARNHEESIVYRNMLKRDGIDVISITQPSVDYKTDILMNALYAVMDERYSIELSENVKRGLKEKASKGIYFSRSPFGYTRPIKKQPLVEYKAESSIVKWIFTEFENGMSTYDIARNLNAKGLKTRTGLNFYKTGVWEILKNPVYKGYLSYSCDDEIFYMKADHEPIVTETQFDNVQKILEERGNKTPKFARSNALCQHWLVGVLRCAVCGTTYVHVKQRSGSGRYRCGRFGAGACKNSYSIKVPDIEEIVLNALQSTDYEQYNFVKSAREPMPLKSRTQSNVKQLEKSLERAKSAYLEGIDTIDEYKANKERITSEIKRLECVLEAKIPSSDSKAAFREASNSLLETLRSNADEKAKNTATRQVISKVVIEPHEKTFRFYFFV